MILYLRMAILLAIGFLFIGCSEEGEIGKETPADTSTAQSNQSDSATTPDTDTPGSVDTSDPEKPARRVTTQPATKSTTMATTSSANNEATKPRVRLKTSLGVIVLELDPDKAPETVKNFLQYVDDGFYEGTIFHRVIPNFMIQGGGFVDQQTLKSQGLRSPIKNEASDELKNLRGTIAMARTNHPHSATSQFFINVKDNAQLDHPTSWGNGWGYCAFGRVVKGMDVVDKIKQVETTTNQSGEKALPLDPPVIIKASRH